MKYRIFISGIKVFFFPDGHIYKGYFIIKTILTFRDFNKNALCKTNFLLMIANSQFLVYRYVSLLTCNLMVYLSVGIWNRKAVGLLIY